MNHLSYKDLVERHDVGNLLADHQNVLICTKCQYLTLDLSNVNDSKVKPNWLECCQKVIDTLSKVGIDFVKHPRTVTAWHTEFREKNQIL